MTNEQSIINYNSHTWIGKVDHLTGERFIYCSECGCEDLGDPKEFTVVEYVNCNEDALVSHSSPLFIIAGEYVY